jgi:hypothetical protein
MDERRRLWQQTPDAAVLKAATEDLAEYPPEIQNIIVEEAKQRGLAEKGGSEDTAFHGSRNAWPLLSKKYRYQDISTTRIYGKPSLLHTDKGELILRGQYVGAGTWILALLATVIIRSLAGRVGVAYILNPLGLLECGIVYVILYYIIRRVRQKKLWLDMQKSEKVILDDEKESFAVLAEFRGKPRWFGLKVEKDYANLASTFSELLQQRCTRSTLEVG